MSTKMVDALPKNAKNAPVNKKGANTFLLKMKPTEGNNVYRVRLLSFLNGINTRDYPFIEKFVHEKWDKDAEGKGVYKGFVTCPATRYVRPTLPPKTDPFKYCPVCDYTNSQFLAYKESGYKDKIASKVVREFKRRYVALIPVYVVKDPHEPTNIKKARVWAIKDKEVYEKLNALIKKQLTKVFNGGKATDLFIYVKSEEEVINEGKENEFKYKTTKIDKMGFGKTEYEIPEINEKFIDEFPFDDEFYTFSTKEELQKFYDDYVISNSSIPEDSLEVDGIETTSDVVDTSSNIVEETIADEKPVSNDPVKDDLDNVDALLNDVMSEEIPAEVKKSAKKNTLKDPAPATTDAEDLDSVINDILDS